MMNIVKFIHNWLQLRNVERTVNKYRVYNEPRIKLRYQPLLNRPVMNVLRIKINNVVMGLLVSSQKKNLPNITYIDYVWVNEKYTVAIDKTNEGMYYQSMYDIFLQWHESFVVKPIKNKKGNRSEHKIALSLNITKERQIERFRRILTLYGFNIDSTLTIEEVPFKTPYREKEKITNVVYSRII